VKFLVYEGNFAGPCNLVKDLTREECLDIKLHAHPSMALVILTGVLLVVIPKVAMGESQRCLASRSSAHTTAKAQVSGTIVKLAEKGATPDFDNPDLSAEPDLNNVEEDIDKQPNEDVFKCEV
jgi:hypothetical protein